MFNDPEETYSLKEKLVVAVLLLPVALVAMIGEKRRLRGERNLLEDDGRGNGVVLNSGGREVVTPQVKNSADFIAAIRERLEKRLA